MNQLTTGENIVQTKNRFSLGSLLRRPILADDADDIVVFACDLLMKQFRRPVLEGGKCCSGAGDNGRITVQPSHLGHFRRVVMTDDVSYRKNDRRPVDKAPACEMRDGQHVIFREYMHGDTAALRCEDFQATQTISVVNPLTPTVATWVQL